MDIVTLYIKKGITFSIILGTVLHFTYFIFSKNKFVGYFSAVNESIWEHTKLAAFPIFIFMIYMIFKLNREINNVFIGLGIGVLLSVIIVPLLFYTYISSNNSF